MRLLIVDDNADAAESLGMLLELDAHEIRIAHSGQEALQTLSDFDAQAAFIDLSMPVMDGYQLAAAIRALPTRQATKLIALTGWGGDDDRKRSSAAGFDAHLTKPIDFDAVEALLKKLVSAA